MQQATNPSDRKIIGYTSHPTPEKQVVPQRFFGGTTARALCKGHYQESGTAYSRRAVSRARRAQQEEMHCHRGIFRAASRKITYPRDAPEGRDSRLRGSLHDPETKKR